MLNGETYHIEIELLVSENAVFPRSVIQTVERLGWDSDEYPRNADYVMELLSQFINGLSEDGMRYRTIAVGKKVVHTRKADVSSIPFERWETCDCKCGCSVPLSSGTCVDCSDGTHQNQNELPEYQYIATLFDGTDYDLRK